MATKIGQLTQELAAGNPWWKDPERWTARDVDLSEAASSGIEYASGALDDLTLGGLHVLRGPRRAGKTVSIKQAIQGLIEGGVPSTHVVHAAVDGRAAKDLRTIIQNATIPPIPTGASRYWFLDEVTSVTGDWASQIKWLRDNDRDFRSSTVVLTGSNAAGLTEARGAFAGRRSGGSDLDRLLLPIGFRTFADLTNEERPDLPELVPADLHTRTGRDAFNHVLPWLDVLVRTWERYLQYGGFPLSVAAVAKREMIPESFIQDLFEVIAGDAFSASRLSAAKEMALLERIWEGMASPLNISNVAEDVDVTRGAVDKHVDYMRDAFLL